MEMEINFQSVVQKAEGVYKGALYWLNMQGLNRTDFDNDSHKIAYQSLAEMRRLLDGAHALYAILGEKVNKAPHSIQGIDERLGDLTIEYTRAVDFYPHDYKPADALEHGQILKRDQRLRDLFEQAGLDPDHI